jgi:hypothetical protein
MAHGSEVTGRGARDARVFFYFLVAEMVPPMSLFLHVVLSTYGVVLPQLHPNTSSRWPSSSVSVRRTSGCALQ